MTPDLLEKVVSLCKRRGFIFPGSEIYGGLAGTWDYGPLGVELKRNLKNFWWKRMVEQRDDIVGFDAAIMMNRKAWEASGHTQAFTDPLIECKICHQRLRADKTLEIRSHEQGHKGEKVEWTSPRNFNLLVKAYFGTVEDNKSEIFLRGEITNGVQVNFKNVVSSTRIRIPFGIAQIGKAFRNEITPGNFIFRSREFEQMEIQFYIKPDTKQAQEWFEYWKNEMFNFYLSLGLKKENMRFRDHADNERAHYARMAVDIEYNSPFGGWAEMMGIHHRGDFDLSSHQKYSGKDMQYKDDISLQEYIPWDIESSAGVDRSVLFFLIDAYTQDKERIFLKLSTKLAPVKVAVFPLLANKEQLVDKARQVYELLKKSINGIVKFDQRGNIGKRYYSQDEIGTPFCITVDFDTLDDNTLTLRDRDSAKQERIPVDKLIEVVTKKLQ